MALSWTAGPQNFAKTSKSATALFNNLGIYRFCLAFAVLDILDLADFLDHTRDNYEKYGYAAVIVGFMVIYFLRWKKVDTSTIAPIIFLLFFVVTAAAFVLNLLVYDDRQGYVSAFLSTLAFSLTIFIPPNKLVLDADKITRDLTFLFVAGTIFYLLEAIVKPLDSFSSIASLHEVQILKSMNCVLALCLCILTNRKTLGLFVIVITGAALALRPTTTLVLALACCLPIALLLRLRVSHALPSIVALSRVIVMGTLLLAVGIPLLFYFFFDDFAGIIASAESYLKSDLLGGTSNMAFRLAILKLAFAGIDNTSFWYGSALSGSHTVSLALNPGFNWWYSVQQNTEAPIHSDWVIVLVLMGIIGYIALSFAFYLVLKNRFSQLGRRDSFGNAVTLQAISIIAVVALLIYCSDQPYLSYYNHTNVVWMLLLISEVARKSKIIQRAGAGRRAIGSGERVLMRSS